MAVIERHNGKMRAVLRKATTLFATTAFFASAVFLVALLWLPSHAAPATNPVDVEPALLLALNTPEPPTPKPQLRQQDLTEEESDLAAVAPRDLVSELNNWSYSSSSLADQVFSLYVTRFEIARSLFSQAVSLELALLRFELSFYQSMLNFVENLRPFSPHR